MPLANVTSDLRSDLSEAKNLGKPGVSIVDTINGGFHRHGVPQKRWWVFLWGKSHLEMDEIWGFPMTMDHPPFFRGFPHSEFRRTQGDVQRQGTDTCAHRS